MKKIKTLSVVVTAYNEGERLSRCLASVHKLAGEIIVIDSSSTDNTAEVAKRFTTKVFQKPNYPMLNKNKNYGFSKATGDWILCLDSDEVVTEELAAEIQKAVKSKGTVGYWIARKNIIFGKWIEHGLWWPDRQLRLFQRGKGKFPEKHVHEYVVVDGPVETLTQPYTHYNYESISQYLGKMENIYTENEVENLRATGYHLRWYDAIRFPVSDFLKIYFAQEGYKDGLHGLVLALLQSFYSFVVFAKLWEKKKFNQEDIALLSVTDELRRVASDTRYWILTAKMKQASWPLMYWHKLLRRFK